MRSMSLRLALALPLMLGLAVPALASDTEEANRRFVAAITSWNEASSLTGDEPQAQERKAELLQQVMGNLDSIVKDYPGSDLAVRLITGEEIGTLSLDGARMALEEARSGMGVAQCLTKLTSDCVFELALQSVAAVNEADRHHALGSIAVSKAQAGRIDEARALIRDIDPSVLRMDHALEVAKADGRPEAMDEALTLALEKEDKASRDHYAGDVAQVQAELGMLAESLSTVELIRDQDAKESALADIAILLAEQGKFEQAFEIADGIEDSMNRPRARRSIAEAQAAVGKKDEAIVTARLIDDPVHRAFTLVAILDPRTDLEAIRAAAMSIEEVQNDDLMFMMARSFAVANARAGLFDEALRVAALIPDEGERDNAFEEVAIAQARAGSVADAVETTRYIDEALVAGRTLKDIAKAQADSGEVEEAIRLARAITDDGYRKDAICEVAAIIGQKGKPDFGIEILREMDPGEICRAESLGRIAASIKG